MKDLVSLLILIIIGGISVNVLAVITLVIRIMKGDK